VTIFELVHGTTPFEPPDDMELPDAEWRAATERGIRTAALRFPTEKLSLPGRLFVTKMLSRDPTARLGAHRLDYDNMRRHPFFSQVRLRGQCARAHGYVAAQSCHSWLQRRSFLPPSPRSSPSACAGALRAAGSASPAFACLHRARSLTSLRSRRGGCQAWPCTRPTPSPARARSRTVLGVAIVPRLFLRYKRAERRSMAKKEKHFGSAKVPLCFNGLFYYGLKSKHAVPVFRCAALRSALRV